MKFIKILLVFLVSLVIFSGCTEKITELRIDPEYFAVTMMVRDPSWDNPLGAEVTLVNRDDQRIVYQGETNVRGQLVLNKVRQGTYFLTITHPDWLTHNEVINVNALSTSFETQMLLREVSRFIQVFDHSGWSWSTIEGAVIKLVFTDDENIVYTETTNYNGLAHFEKIRNGSYFITITAEDFFTYTGIFTSNVNINWQYVLNPSFVSGEILIRNQSWSDLPNALVELVFVDDPNITFSSISNQFGSASFSRINAGRYYITITADGFVARTFRWDLDRNGFSYQFAMESLIVNGRVRVFGESWWNHIEGATVLLISPENTYTVTTNSWGEANFNNIVRGTYQLVVAASGFQNYNTTIIIGYNFYYEAFLTSQ